MNKQTHRLRSLWKNDAWIKPFFARYRRTLWVALGLGVLTFAFAALLMFSAGYLVSGAAIVESILLLHLPLIFVRIFGVGKPLLQYIERLTSHNWVLRMTSELRLRLYRALESDAPPLRAARKTGDILGLLSEDIGHIQNLYLRTVFPLIIAWLLYLAVVAALGFFSLFMALFALITLGVVVFLVPLVSVLSCGARQLRAKQLKNNLYADLTDNVLGVGDWIFAQRSAEYVARHERTQAALHEEERALNRFARRRDLVLHALFAGIAVALLLWAGAYFGGDGPGGNANWIAAFTLGFFPLIEVFAPLSTATVEASAHADSIENLNRLPQMPETNNGESPEAPAPAAFPHAPFTIELDNVVFRYENTERNVLEGVSLNISPGEKVAVLGRSGAGKSTLASIIRGDSVPQEGVVLVGGVAPSLVGANIARTVSVIQQNPYVFNMTLLENVRLGAPDAAPEQVSAVLEAVGLGALVNRLPHGLNTLVDEAGMRFSGGERHRIALARVLLQNTPIVILDEPTVGLDPATERALLETIFTTLKDKTVIMITHHLQGTALCDRVVFINNGAVSLEGSPEYLEKTSEYFRMLQKFDRGF